MLDISQATHLLTSMGVSSTLAARAAERAAQKQTDTDPLTFLKELRSTLEELSAEASSTAADGAAGQNESHQPTPTRRRTKLPTTAPRLEGLQQHGPPPGNGCGILLCL